MDIRTHLQNEQIKIKNEWHQADSWLSTSQDSGQAGAVEKKRPAAPFVIRLVNACSSSIADVDVGDSVANRASGSAAFSNFGQNANITLTSVISGTSYIEFLAQSESQPFAVGQTVVISATPSQFNEVVTITHRDASGNRKDHVIGQVIDPYQRQTDRLIIDYKYLFDGYTRIRFSNIVGSATVTIHIYPEEKFTGIQKVAGRSSINEYSPPDIVKVLPTAAPERERTYAEQGVPPTGVPEKQGKPKRRRKFCFYVYD